MEILDKKSNRMSRVIVGVSERSEFPKLQRILDFLSLRNLLSNELFFTFLFLYSYLKNCYKLMYSLICNSFLFLLFI